MTFAFPSRRRFLGAAAALPLIGGALPALGQTREGAVVGRVLAMSDLHSAYERSAQLLAALRAEVSAVSVDEATTKAEIAHAHAAWGRIVCPHTAVALAAARRLDRNGAPIVALSTAHPSKFGAFVSDVIGVEPVPAPVIRALGDRPERLTVIENTPEAALAAVKGFAEAG